MSDAAAPHGLQQERTTLSWRRSTLALCAVALLVARAGLVADAAAVVLLTIVGIAAALWVVALTLVRSYWRIASPANPELSVLRGGGAPLAVVGVVTALCLAVVLLALGV